MILIFLNPDIAFPIFSVSSLPVLLLSGENRENRILVVNSIVYSKKSSLKLTADTWFFNLLFYS